MSETAEHFDPWQYTGDWHVKQFAEAVAELAKEIHCDGGTSIASHKVPSTVDVECENSEDEFRIVGLRAERLLGCGCWSGIRIIVCREPAGQP